MAAEQLSDKENQFKKRARRRLVGAVALVLLMVTVLPMVLDDRSGQKTPQPEIALSIPSQDGQFSSKIIPVTDEPPAAATPQVQMAPPLETPAQPAAQEPNPDNAVSEVSKPANPEPQAVAPAEPKPAAEPKVSEPKVSELKPEPKPVESKSAKAAPVETAKAQPVETAVKKGTVSVQIGVFSDAAKVAQMRSKIADSGVQCYTESINTDKGGKIRLRCGPYPTRADAQTALDRIKLAGFGGILVTNQ